MRIGGQRKLIVPSELAYGKKGIGEVPPDATLEFEVGHPHCLSLPAGSDIGRVYEIPGKFID